MPHSVVERGRIDLLGQKTLSQPGLDFDVAGTLRAGSQMPGESLGLLSVQPSGVIQRRQLGNVPALHEAPFFAHSGASLCRNAWRARLIRDITVPIGTDRITAISWQVKPSTTPRSSTVRCSTAMDEIASATSSDSATDPRA